MQLSIQTITAGILAGMLLWFILVQVNQRLASPMLAILDRWLRWAIVAVGSAMVFHRFGWIDKPFPVLVVVFFLVWFLIETMYNWLLISAESLSPLPFFPRYSVNTSGEEWPVQPRLMKVREWLRAQGFRQVQALKVELTTGVYLRVSVYQDAQALVRVQVSFLPQANGAICVCYGVSSLLSDGSRIVTDNLHVPFGGFFPDDWYVERRPWSRSLPALLKRHHARVAKFGQEPVPITSEPLAEMNTAQHELDQLNTELGFLHPHAEREDLGKFTQAGRYRLWKEIWMLNYLGRPARYL